MFVTDAIVAISEYLPESTRSDRNRAIQESVATLCIGEHGDQYKYDKPSPADFEAILNCGCNRFFPVPTQPGELLYCGLHDDWFKSTPAITKKKPPEGKKYHIKCNTCGFDRVMITQNKIAYDQARRHAFGVRNKRIDNPHDVLMGKEWGDGFEFRKYEPRKKG